MKLPLVVFAIWFSLAAISEGTDGSARTSGSPQQTNAGGSQSANPNNAVDSCWYGLCLGSYAKYYNEIILEKKDYQWGMWDYVSYKSAVQYFRVLEYTPIRSIKAAFETCKKYKKTTREKCEQFFSVFLAKGFTIDLIAEYCVKNASVCEDPEKRLNIYYGYDVTLQDNTLKFHECMEKTKGENDPIIFENLRLVRLLNAKIRENKASRNRCSCHQVHALALALRFCFPEAQIREFHASHGFDEFLSAICITTDVTDRSLMWTPDMINLLAGAMVTTTVTSNERFLLTKEILLREKYIVPIYNESSHDWTLNYIFETAHTISGGITDYRSAVDLIVRGMRSSLKMDVFRSIIQTADVITSRIAGRITLPKTPPLKSQFLTLKSLFFTKYSTMGYPFSSMVNRCPTNDYLYLNDILDFFVEYYISKSK